MQGSDKQIRNTEIVQDVERAKQLARAKTSRAATPELAKQFSDMLDKIASELFEIQAEESAHVQVPKEQPQAQAVNDRKPLPEPKAVATKGKEPVAVEGEGQTHEDAAERSSETSVDAAAPEEVEVEAQAESVDDPAEGEAAAVLAATLQADLETAESLSVEGRIIEESGDEPKKAAAQAASSEEQSVEEAPLELPKELPAQVSARAHDVAFGRNGQAQKSEKAAQNGLPASEEKQAIQDIVQQKLDSAQGGANQAELQRSVVKESIETRALFNATERMLSQRTSDITAKLDQAAKLVAAATQDKDSSNVSPVLRQAMESAGQRVSGIVKVGASALNNGELGSALAQKANAQKDEAESSKALPRALQLRTMEKVESALKEVSKSKDGKTISVRLDPPSLGSVKVDISLRDGSLHARIVAESPQVNALLREKAHELQNLLRKTGLDLERVSVSVGYQQHGEAGGGSSSDFQSFQQRSGFADTLELEEAGPAVSAKVEESIITDHWVA